MTALIIALVIIALKKPLFIVNIAVEIILTENNALTVLSCHFMGFGHHDFP